VNIEVSKTPLKLDEIVKRPIFLAPQVFSEDSKGFAKSQELGTSSSNSLRFLTLNPLPLPQRLEWRSEILFTKPSKLNNDIISLL